MVFLNELQSQWPWNGQEQELSDKEIYTHRISHQNPTEEWRIPILLPLRGYAYTGIRLVVYGKTSDYTMVTSLFKGVTGEPVFGDVWDRTQAQNGSWVPLGFPLTNKIICMTEHGLEYVVKHDVPCWGKVEFIAQRFEDLQEEEDDISYLFLHHETKQIECILTEKNTLYRPQPETQFLFLQKVKIMPSLLYLLDQNKSKWPDMAMYWERINFNLSLPLFL